VKPARRQSYRCRNIDSAVPVKIGDRSQLWCIPDAVTLMWSQAAIRIREKDGHIV